MAPKRSLISILIVILILFVVLAITWLLIPPMGDYAGPNSPASKDWKKLQPLGSAITWSMRASPNNFTAMFANRAEASIKINSVSAIDIISNTACTKNLTVNNIAYGTCSAGVCIPDASQVVSVPEGNGFELNILCPTAKAEGGPYQMRIAINYSAVINSINSDYIENGTIQGYAE
jgi:hypothetical protein